MLEQAGFGPAQFFGELSFDPAGAGEPAVDGRRPKKVRKGA